MDPPTPIQMTRGCQPRSSAAGPSSLRIWRAQSATPAYCPRPPSIIMRVLSTSRGVVASPVTAPAMAPATECSAGLSSRRPPSTAEA
ncbi:hypothetical protein F751_0562 [Auxenochlorella protothecoides]|uniref:Uncharacterized protein n=1 Tax=Auxenochlorella protothecoides TaxID=3075 RepID=A0A087SII1_AUXPR|nr:hypothetical protein F751_0562 [Auxenochlorella protothecoides]KFM25535.1 hypothetical protein F751_0562 [Auxenochlorella protothecoides]